MLADEPLCRLCSENGKVKSATVVDHVKAHKDDPILFWDRGNLRPLCKPCHDSKTARQDNDHAFGRWSRIPEWIGLPIIPVTLVCGPPGSGRTAYTEKHASRDSLIIDPAYIVSELSGRMPHESPIDKWISPAMQQRNTMLASLSKPRARNYPDAWVIVSAPRLSDRRKWRKILQPRMTIVLETSKEGCIERIANRLDTDAKAVNAWWKQYTSDMFDEVQVVSG